MGKLCCMYLEQTKNICITYLEPTNRIFETILVFWPLLLELLGKPSFLPPPNIPMCQNPELNWPPSKLTMCRTCHPLKNGSPELATPTHQSCGLCHILEVASPGDRKFRGWPVHDYVSFWILAQGYLRVARRMVHPVYRLAPLIADPSLSNTIQGQNLPIQKNVNFEPMMQCWYPCEIL